MHFYLLISCDFAGEGRRSKAAGRCY